MISVAVPTTGPTAARMVTTPCSSVITTPEESTVAPESLLLDQTRCGVGTVSPLTSVAIALKLAVSYVTTVSTAGTIVMLIVGICTVAEAVPSTPSTRARMDTTPRACPVKVPAGETVTMDESLLSHVTAPPVTTAPAASRAVAVSCRVAGTRTMGFAGVISTVRTRVVGPVLLLQSTTNALSAAKSTLAVVEAGAPPWDTRISVICLSVRGQSELL